MKDVDLTGGEHFQEVKIDINTSSPVASVNFVLRDEETRSSIHHMGRDFEVPLVDYLQEDVEVEGQLSNKLQNSKDAEQSGENSCVWKGVSSTTIMAFQRETLSLALLPLLFQKCAVDQYESDLLSVVHSLLLSMTNRDLQIAKINLRKGSCIRFALAKFLRHSGYDAAV